MVKRRANDLMKNAKKPRIDPVEPFVPKAPQNGKPSAPIPLSDIPFSLPFPMFKQVFGSLSPADIMRFILSSTTSFNFLHNSLHVPATRIEFSNSRTDDFCILINTPNQTPCSIEIRSKRMGEEMTEKVWGRAAKISMKNTFGTDCIDLIFEKRHDTRMVALEMSKFVLNVFKTNNIDMENCGTDNIFNCVKGVRSFGKVAIRWDTPGSMNLEKLQWFLETMSADAMCLEVFLPRIKYTGAINKRILKTSYASWLTGESLLKMNCETLIASGTKLSATDLNVFIDEWKKNTDKFWNLELIHLQQHDRFPIDPEELNLEKWPPSGEYPENIEVLNPENTWFCRRGDMLATLELGEDNVVMFCVWHEEFLTKELDHQLEPERVRKLLSGRLCLRHCHKEFKDHIEKSMIVFERLTFHLCGNEYLEDTPEQFFNSLKTSSTVHVKTLSLHFRKSFARDDRDFGKLKAAFLDEFQTFLRRLNGKLHVEKLVMENAGNHREVLQVLPYLQPGVLKKIQFLHKPLSGNNGHVTMNLRQIAQTEQWKQAKEWDMYVLSIDSPFQKWKHFSKMRFSYEKLGEMMKHFIASPSFQTCEIKSYVMQYVDCQSFVRFFTQYNPSITSKRINNYFCGINFKIDAGDFVVKVLLKTGRILIEKVKKSDDVQETGRGIVRLEPVEAIVEYRKYLCF